MDITYTDYLLLKLGAFCLVAFLAGLFGYLD